MPKYTHIYLVLIAKILLIYMYKPVKYEIYYLMILLTMFTTQKFAHNWLVNKYTYMYKDIWHVHLNDPLPPPLSGKVNKFHENSSLLGIPKQIIMNPGGLLMMLCKEKICLPIALSRFIYFDSWEKKLIAHNIVITLKGRIPSQNRVLYFIQTYTFLFLFVFCLSSLATFIRMFAQVSVTVGSIDILELSNSTCQSYNVTLWTIFLLSLFWVISL